MSQSYNQDKTTPQASIVTDLSACFKYPLADDTSVISDVAEIKKRSQDKKICKVTTTNVGESPLTISHKTNESHETTVSVNYKPDATKVNGLDTPLSFASIHSSISENPGHVVPKTIKKINFAGFENMNIGNSLHVYKKDFVDSSSNNSNANQSVYDIKRINFSLHGRFSFEEDALKFEDKVLSRNLKLFRKGIYKYKVKRVMSGNPDSNTLASMQQKPEKCCNCKSSKCLKLYCECFKAKGYCLNSCKCIDCGNRPATNEESKVNSSPKVTNPIKDYQVQKPSELLTSNNPQSRTDFNSRPHPRAGHKSSLTLDLDFASEKPNGDEVDLARRMVPNHCHCFSKDCVCGNSNGMVLEYGLYDFQNQS